MCNDKIIRRIAGLFVMASVALGYLMHPGFLFFTAFVGFNLFQSSITNFCSLELMLGKAGMFGCAPRSNR
ncbi:DUF2892 domain-containing protein [Gemmatimonas sp.]|uniref:YgaP family membrane protein n=1 Tax=Gemmatimonas sp. TaxID=1962908 RepID=UPI003562B59C